MAWFVTGLYHETIRLAKKYKRLREHELLILNDFLSRSTEGETMEMIDGVAATNDISVETEDSVFLQEALSLLTSQQQKIITATILEERPEHEII
ncbi:MAG TPA: hypothetical protein PKA28_03470 [Methylomusa anaerophila]|uniref:Uncharacterized protein n=1 Tax=Methylomusa anaerophila TaxID=1930071 RepID=A0A348ANL3_9FIRM|nr:sigma-70 family RNA polymerase sigma factor [Methylomusa anaerophila]BBB92661.1 hypothetical protein MAMMFC1_03356 [Methylomusa anaerophila]HML87486.1 hypothetical protein [Methylomusa anaerophila]